MVPRFFEIKLFLFSLSSLLPCFKVQYKEVDEINSEMDSVVAKNFDLIQILKIQTNSERLDKIQKKTEQYDRYEAELKQIYHKLKIVKRTGRSQSLIEVDPTNSLSDSISDHSSQITENPVKNQTQTPRRKNTDHQLTVKKDELDILLDVE